MTGPLAETLEDVLARLRAKGAAAQAEIEALPCRRHDDYEGAAACRAARAFEGCRYAQQADICPRQRRGDADVEFSRHLQRAEVPTAVRELLTTIRRDRAQLKTTLAIRAVAALVKRERLDHDGPDGAAHLTGTERLLVLAGPPGVGKTIAACYGLGKLGGRYTRGYLLGDRRSRGELVRERCLVVDQLGRIQDGEGRARTATAVEELLDVRCGERTLTILCGNFFRAQFDEEFGAAVVSRLKGHGAWIECLGADLRCAA